jgi:hypothetical protein
MEQMNLEASGIATLTEFGDTTLIESSEAFDYKDVRNEDAYLVIGNLYFPKDLYVNFDVLSKEGLQYMKECLAIRSNA